MVVTHWTVIHSVTTPGTEQSVGAGKAASTAKGESQRGDSPIVQEPEEPQLHQESLSPRRSSLIIVESTEEQTENSGRGYEEESLEKVNEQLFLNVIDAINRFLCLAHFLRIFVMNFYLALSLFSFPLWLQGSGKGFSPEVFKVEANPRSQSLDW